MRLIIVGILIFIIFIIICAFNNHPEIEKKSGSIPPKNHLKNEQYIDTLFLFDSYLDRDYS